MSDLRCYTDDGMLLSDFNRCKNKDRCDTAMMCPRLGANGDVLIGGEMKCHLSSVPPAEIGKIITNHKDNSYPVTIAVVTEIADNTKANGTAIKDAIGYKFGCNNMKIIKDEAGLQFVPLLKEDKYNPELTTVIIIVLEKIYENRYNRMQHIYKST